MWMGRYLGQDGLGEQGLKKSLEASVLTTMTLDKGTSDSSLSPVPAFLSSVSSWEMYIHARSFHRPKTSSRGCLPSPAEIVSLFHVLQGESSQGVVSAVTPSSLTLFLEVSFLPLHKFPPVSKET